MEEYDWEKGYDWENAIKKAKRICERHYREPHPERREWVSTHVDSYGTSRERVQLIVHTGSPAKGYVIVNYGTKKVLAVSNTDRVLRSFYVYYEPTLVDEQTMG